MLRTLPPAGRYVVGYSGGLDSSVLLHALHGVRNRLNARIAAIHVNHHLHPEAGYWDRFAKARCEALTIPCETVELSEPPPPGMSLEAWARQQRYRVFERVLGSGEMLLLAHQRDDQAETLLLQLLRGAGPHGLAAMPKCKRFAQGWLARPLLDTARSSLEGYARSHALAWIDDPSNRDPRFHRNYLRRQITPVLQQGWPGYRRTLSRAAALQAEAAALLDELAFEDLARIQAREELLIPHLRELSGTRCRNLLRAWIVVRGHPVPSAVKLHQIVREVIGAGPDRQPLVAWKDTEVRRYRDRLFIMRPLGEAAGKMHTPWVPGRPLELASGTLTSSLQKGQGLCVRLCQGKRLEIRFRRGGERARLAGQAHTRSLKQLFQEAAIPPWVRDRTPLIYIDDELAAVAGLGVGQRFAAGAVEPGWVLAWQPRG